MFDISKNILVYNACCENFCLLLSLISTTETANITCSFEIIFKFQSPATKKQTVDYKNCHTHDNAASDHRGAHHNAASDHRGAVEESEASSHIIGFLKAIKDLRLNVTKKSKRKITSFGCEAKIIYEKHQTPKIENVAFTQTHK